MCFYLIYSSSSSQKELSTQAVPALRQHTPPSPQQGFSPPVLPALPTCARCPSLPARLCRPSFLSGPLGALPPPRVLELDLKMLSFSYILSLPLDLDSWKFYFTYTFSSFQCGMRDINEQLFGLFTSKTGVRQSTIRTGVHMAVRISNNEIRNHRREKGQNYPRT